MELVYLWVEDYKNIKRQGFNFSPRFDCKYDEDTNELTIDENKDYVSIFPKNINITAIVGENGSGKSGILESLIALTTFDKTINKEVSFFFILFQNKIYYKKCINIQINNDYEILKEVPLLYFNYNLDYINTKDFKFDDFYHRRDNYEIPTVLLPSKKNRKIDIGNIDYIVERNMLDFAIRNELRFQNIEKFFLIHKFKLSINKNKIMSGRLSEAQYDISTSQSFIKDDIKNNIYRYWENLSNENKEQDLYLLNNLYLVKKIYNNRKKVIHDDLKKLLKADVNNISNEDIEKILNIIRNSEFEEIFENDIGMDKILDTFSFKESQVDISRILNDNKHNINEYKNSEELILLPSWIDIEFYDINNINLKDLSYGQKFLTRFIYTLLYQVIKIGQHYKESSFLILLDEVELGLHPQWQKEFLQLIMKILNVYSETKFYLVFASHSPFILSDIPKENVIFLEKGKQVYPFKDNQQTFGANIHTLLSHGFFMKDGLMGEFAKSKIDTVIKYLNQIKLSDEEISYCENIISIIGEPIIKRELQRKLDSKKLSKLDKIDEIEEQMKLLEHRLEIIRKNQK